MLERRKLKGFFSHFICGIVFPEREGRIVMIKFFICSLGFAVSSCFPDREFLKNKISREKEEKKKLRMSFGIDREKVMRYTQGLCLN